LRNDEALVNSPLKDQVLVLAVGGCQGADQIERILGDPSLDVVAQPGIYGNAHQDLLSFMVVWVDAAPELARSLARSPVVGGENAQSIAQIFDKGKVSRKLLPLPVQGSIDGPSHRFCVQCAP
jgi:hypothetical protein